MVVRFDSLEEHPITITLTLTLTRTRTLTLTLTLTPSLTLKPNPNPDPKVPNPKFLNPNPNPWLEVISLGVMPVQISEQKVVNSDAKPGSAAAVQTEPLNSN